MSRLRAGRSEINPVLSLAVAAKHMRSSKTIPFSRIRNQRKNPRFNQLWKRYEANKWAGGIYIRNSGNRKLLRSTATVPLSLNISGGALLKSLVGVVGAPGSNGVTIRRHKTVGKHFAGVLPCSEGRLVKKLEL